MCGIFGVLTSPTTALAEKQYLRLLTNLYHYSESRGKESAGLHCFSAGAEKSYTLKSAMPAKEFVKTPKYRDVISKFWASAKQGGLVVAHSRLVTNGAATQFRNNQPISSDSITAVHNGIIINVDELWEKHIDFERSAEVDTEVIVALLNNMLALGMGAKKATAEVFSQIKGSASVAWLRNDRNEFCLATNTGDLYYWYDDIFGCLVFASEHFILSSALFDTGLIASKDNPAISWLKPGSVLLADTGMNINGPVGMESLLDDGAEQGGDTCGCLPSILIESVVESNKCVNSAVIPGATYSPNLLNYNESSIAALKRCSRCILPETFPYISFDAEGVCNYCHAYQPRYKYLNPQKAIESFLSDIEKYRRTDGKTDVLVPFSGGRDSSYGLHLIKKTFGFTPITFTYDWGMVTDLARRNIARMCGALGVQNILVSANIPMKRTNIKKNVSAWLKNPVLGLIPLFMAGDKHFFSIVNQIKRQTGISLDLWSANPLENTDFKSGFCGVSPDFDKERLDYLSMGRKAKMAAFYGLNFLKNPRYINTSLLDTLKAFSAYYLEPRENFYFMFDHIVWSEDEVNNTLLNEYDFEKAPDTNSTWRIGDGTAPFYNYIYVTTKGFSEFDTFRSNQIREGMISRDRAIEKVVVENRPRPESIKWYLDAIRIDFDYAIKVINDMDLNGLHQ